MALLDAAAVSYQVVLTKIDKLRAAELAGREADVAAGAGRPSGRPSRIRSSPAPSSRRASRRCAPTLADAARALGGMRLTGPAISRFRHAGDPNADERRLDRMPRQWLHRPMLTEALPFMRRYAGQDLRHQIWRPRDGRRGAGRRLRRATSCCCKQVGHQPGRRAWRRAADRPHAGAARDQERVRRRPARHRRARRWRSWRWSCPGRSTSRSSPRSTAAGGRADRPVRQGRRHDQARRLTRTTRDPDSNIEKVIDLGFVGEPEHVDPHVLDVLQHVGHHPGHRADRRRRGRRDLQHQRRHGGRRRRRRAEGRRACCC